MNPLTSTANSIARPNPFSTMFTRPGAIDFLVDQPEFLPSVVDSFRENHFLGQIVGPHGCGKTTLTVAIENALSNEFDSCRRVTIRGSRDVSSSDTDSRRSNVARTTAKQLLIVDGSERMSWLHQRMLIQNCRSNEYALIITTHRWIRGVPLLCELKPELKTLIRLVERLAPELEIDRSLLKSVFQRSGGNLRESLMDMYDWFERRRQVASRGC